MISNEIMITINGTLSAIGTVDKKILITSFDKNNLLNLFRLLADFILKSPHPPFSRQDQLYKETPNHFSLHFQ